MATIFGIPTAALYGQLLVGLINGSFYAMLSLGLAIIFGMLQIINFAHGALYMMGAFTGYLLLTYAGVGYWPALILVPVIVGIFVEVSTLVIPSELKYAGALFVLILILLVRPQGLLGRRERIG